MSARVPQGKALLMRAAARLAARQGSAHTLVLREVAREAGLNHNTFYRHFASLDDMMCSVVDEFGRDLRAGLEHARKTAPPDVPLAVHLLSWLFEFAREHPDTFSVAMRERYGPAGPLRDAARAVLEGLCDDMARELRALDRSPARLRRVLRVVLDQAFQACMEYLETPQRRRELLQRGHELFETLITGASALAAPRTR